MNGLAGVIPAAGTVKGDFAKVTGVELKALMPFHGETMLARSIRCLRAQSAVDRILVVGPATVKEEAQQAGADAVIAPVGSAPANVFEAIRYLKSLPSPPLGVFIVTADLPLLEPDHLARFLQTPPTDRDIKVSIIEEKEYTSCFPGATATFAQLKGGRFALGGAFLVNLEAFQRCLPSIEDAFANRKSPFKMAKLLGPAFLLKYAFRRLSADQAVARVEQILGVSCVAVRGCPPELAYDIDDLADYYYLVDKLT